MIHPPALLRNLNAASPWKRNEIAPWSDLSGSFPIRPSIPGAVLAANLRILRNTAKSITGSLAALDTDLRDSLPVALSVARIAFLTINDFALATIAPAAHAISEQPFDVPLTITPAARSDDRETTSASARIAIVTNHDALHHAEIDLPRHDEFLPFPPWCIVREPSLQA